MLKKRTLVEYELTDEQIEAFALARNVIEAIVMEGEPDEVRYTFNGSNHRLTYDELLTAAYLMTKILGGRK